MEKTPSPNGQPNGALRASAPSSSALTPTKLPPSRPGVPYTLSSLDGEVLYIPLSRSATRLLVTGAESSNAFAIVGSGGSQSGPIGFHYHHEAHDVFLCLQGSVNVWAGESCRTLGEGDFASVPPGTVHQYQFLGPHAEMVGLIVPGGWEEFFRFVGDSYDGPMWPVEDERKFPDVMLPRLKAAAEKFDMVPCPDHKGVEPQPWKDGDIKLPGDLEPYFLKGGIGPAWVVGGEVCQPLVTAKESNGRFAIGCVEGSGHCDLREGVFARPGRQIRFGTAHHAFLVVQGAIEFSVGSSDASTLHASELTYVPANTPFCYREVSRFAKMYVFTNEGGLVELYQQLGVRYASPVLPEKAVAWDEGELRSLSSGLGFEVIEV